MHVNSMFVKRKTFVYSVLWTRVNSRVWSRFQPIIFNREQIFNLDSRMRFRLIKLKKEWNIIAKFAQILFKILDCTVLFHFNSLLLFVGFNVLLNIWSFIASLYNFTEFAKQNRFISTKYIRIFIDNSFRKIHFSLFWNTARSNGTQQSYNCAH